MMNADDTVEVWVEVPSGEYSLSGGSSLGKSPIKKKVINNASETKFVRGWAGADSYMAFELMKNAVEARSIVDAAMKSTKKHALRKATIESDIDIIVSIYDHTNDSALFPGACDSSSELVCSAQSIFPSNTRSLIASTHDFTALTYMEEPNILFSLKFRYTQQHFYTNVSNILVAVNPYEQLDIYGPTSMMQYRSHTVHGKTTGNNPHVFSIAEEAFSSITAPYSLKKQSAPTNQSLIVCGESGSGKTENSKYLMRYLANRTYDLTSHLSDAQSHSLIEKSVLEANVILESLGNANTLLNHNSSRFGKFTKIFVTTRSAKEEEPVDPSSIGKVIGAATETYLLEKSRVVFQSPGERNFHIFYQLCFGLTQSERDRMFLGEMQPSDFHLLNQGDCYQVSGIDDVSWFTSFRKGLAIIGIDHEVEWQILSVICALMHIGNVSFRSNGSSNDGSVLWEDCEVHLEAAATLLGIPATMLRLRLTSENIRIMNDVVQKQLNPEVAVTKRDALIRTTYDNLFIWIVERINLALVGQDVKSWIGILDVFGFESFENNSFEQFCINFANERLQQHFNYSILLSEQKEYALEGIIWEHMDIPDHSNTIELVLDRSSGIVALLNSACKMKSSTPDSFVSSIFKMHPSNNSILCIPRTGGPRHIRREFGFGIKHYAGIVWYNSSEFLAKNTDYTDPDATALLSSSTVTLVSDLVTPVFTRKERLGLQDVGSKPKDSSISNPRRHVAKTNFSSVATEFTRQLSTLIDTLSTTQSFFIRCVKPNTEKQSGVFDPIYVRPQLKCGGLVEAVKMLKKGFPTRVTLDEIYKQYSPLLNPQPVFELNKRDFAQAVLSLFDCDPSEYQLGLTKVFFKAGKRALLESVMSRETSLSHDDMAMLMRFLMQKRWQRVIATTKTAVHCKLRIFRHRALEMFLKSIRLAIVYNKTFKRSLLRIREKRYLHSAITIQSSFRAVLYHFRTAIEIRRIEVERKRIEAEKQRQKQLEMDMQAANDARRIEIQQAREQYRLDVEQRKREESEERQKSIEEASESEKLRVARDLDDSLKPLVDDIVWWINMLLGTDVTGDFFLAISSGEVLRRVAELIALKMNIDLTSETENEKTPIKVNFNKFSRVCSQLGIIANSDAVYSNILNEFNGRRTILFYLQSLRRIYTTKCMSFSPSVELFVDTLEIDDLTAQLESLQLELKDSEAENRRLKAAIVTLDEVNRKMVVDLMKELSSRSQGRPLRRSHSRGPSLDFGPSSLHRGVSGGSRLRDSVIYDDEEDSNVFDLSSPDSRSPRGQVGRGSVRLLRGVSVRNAPAKANECSVM